MVWCVEGSLVTGLVIYQSRSKPRTRSDIHSPTLTHFQGKWPQRSYACNLSYVILQDHISGLTSSLPDYKSLHRSIEAVGAVLMAYLDPI